MTRLIDADKLTNKSCPMGKRKYCSNCGEKRTITNPYTNQSISCDDIRFDFLQMIDREKTVKAIPVEWIEEYAEKVSEFDEKARINIFTVIYEMLEYWEADNGSNNISDK